MTALRLRSRQALGKDRAVQGDRIMKRSRRVVLTMMGTTAIGAVTTGFAPRHSCAPGESAVPGVDGRLYCRGAAWYGGFGGTLHHVHGHGHEGGHGHAGGGG
jgi:hypothetical protein